MTLSTTVNAGQGTPGRRSPRSRLALPRGRRGWARVVLAVLLLALATDSALLASRVHRLDVDLSTGGGDTNGRTWVLLGLDSRADLPADADVADFGSTAQVPGARTDVVIVVHQTDQGTTAFSVPRDVLVHTDRRIDRLALAWLDGPQGTVDALCSLGIPTDHLVTVDLRGFATLVDAAGGLDVDVPEPVRDEYTGLGLTRAGRQHVDGLTALAMVRSRHPEHLVDGRWLPAPVDPDGRATAAATVLSALVDQVHGALARPWRLQRIGWTASGAVRIDPGTSLPELASLARADLGPVQVLPVAEPLGDTLVRLPTSDTTAALRAAGMSCGS